jgi:hypothetical protein
MTGTKWQNWTPYFSAGSLRWQNLNLSAKRSGISAARVMARRETGMLS